MRFGRRRLTLCIASLFACAVAAAAAAVVAQGAPKAGKPPIQIFGYGFKTFKALGNLWLTQTYIEQVANAAVDAINSAGGVNGAKLEFTFCDDETDPNTVQACARKAASGPYAVAMVMPSLFDFLAVPITAKAGLPTVAEQAEEPAVWNDPSVFCYTSGTVGLLHLLGPLAHQIGVKKLAEIHYGGLGFSDEWTQWIKEGAATGGIQMGGATTVPQTTTDFTPAITQVMSSGADGIVPILLGLPPALQQIRRAYPQAKILEPSFILQPSEIKSAGSAANGIHVAAWAQPVTATNVPGIQQFIKETKGKLDPSWYYYENAVLDWLAVHFVAKVAATVKGPVTRASMMAAFRKANNIDMMGIVPPWNGATLGKHHVACQPANAAVEETIKNGLPVADHPGVFVDATTGRTTYVVKTTK
jgi:ABC-type branched-subunit amino acid transport system substrate-binding protein